MVKVVQHPSRNKTVWEELVRHYEEPSRPVLIVDDELNIRAMSVGLAKSFDLDEAAVIGTPALDLLHPDDGLRAAEVVMEVLAHSGARPPGLYRVRDGLDSYRSVDIGAIHETFVDPDGRERIALVYQVVELTDRRRAEALATEQVEVMELLTGRSTLEECLAALCRLGERHLDNTTVRITQLQVPEDAPPHAADAAARGLAALSASGQGPSGDEVGSLVTSPIRSSNGDLIGYAEGFRNKAGTPTNTEWSVFELVGRLSGLFIERIRKDEQLAHAASHDPLTDLANRRLLNEELQRLCDDREPFALAVIDLDQFAWINSTFGHLIGDEILIETAARLTRTLGERALVARPGGDEFVALIPGVDSATQLESIGERLNTALSEPAAALGGRRHIRASIGLITTAADDNPERALASADAAMFVAKRAGGDACHIPAGMAGESHRQRFDMIRGLADAIANDRLHLVYQPMVELETGRWINLEALVRWEEDGRVVAGPEEFVSLAEQSDLILSLDEWVVTTAGAQMAAWQSSGLLPEGGVVWTNVSPRSIERPDFVELVQRASTGGTQGALGVEVTERAVDTDPATVATMLAKVRRAGIPVALDDFGTGVASLQQLAEFPATDLKIDGSFVEQMLVSDTYLTLVDTILGLAERLGMTVTAEAIETKEQLDLLRDRGCTLGQGFHIALPMTPTHLEEWDRSIQIR